MDIYFNTYICVTKYFYFNFFDSHVSSKPRFLCTLYWPPCLQRLRSLRRKGKTYREISKRINPSEEMITNALKLQKNTENRGKPRNPTRETNLYINRLAKRDLLLTSVGIRELQGK